MAECVMTAFLGWSAVWCGLVGFGYLLGTARTIRRAEEFVQSAYVEGSDDTRERFTSMMTRYAAEAHSGLWYVERFNLNEQGRVLRLHGHWHIFTIHRHRHYPIHPNSGRGHAHFVWRHHHPEDTP